MSGRPLLAWKCKDIHGLPLQSAHISEPNLTVLFIFLQKTIENVNTKWGNSIIIQIQLGVHDSKSLRTTDLDIQPPISYVFTVYHTAQGQIITRLVL